MGFEAVVVIVLLVLAQTPARALPYDPYPWWCRILGRR
jgi:hypothetical protein